MLLHIEDLADVCVTRKRGREAFDAVVRRDDGAPMQIDLKGTKLLSLSFLDELIFDLSQAGMLSRLAFVAENENHVLKLGRVSGIRKLPVRRIVAGEPQIVEPNDGPTPTEVTASEEPPEGQD